MIPTIVIELLLAFSCTVGSRGYHVYQTLLHVACPFAHAKRALRPTGRKMLIAARACAFKGVATCIKSDEWKAPSLNTKLSLKLEPLNDEDPKLSQ